MHLVEVDEDFVRRIISIFSVTCPYTLRNVFVAEFINDNNFYAKFSAISTDLGLIIPDSIKKH